MRTVTDHINDLMKVEGVDKGSVSDGFYTFDELYEHRIVLYIALCKSLRNASAENDLSFVWKTKLHSNGSSFEGWFVLGIGKEPGEQITYYLPMDKWEEVNFAEELQQAPEFDGHTSKDVLERLKKL